MSFQVAVEWLEARLGVRVLVASGHNDTSTSLNVTGVLAAAGPDVEFSFINPRRGRRAAFTVAGASFVLLEGDIEKVEIIEDHPGRQLLIVTCVGSQTLLVGDPIDSGALDAMPAAAKT